MQPKDLFKLKNIRQIQTNLFFFCVFHLINSANWYKKIRIYTPSFFGFFPFSNIQLKHLF